MLVALMSLVRQLLTVTVWQGLLDAVLDDEPLRHRVQRARARTAARKMQTVTANTAPPMS